MRSSILFVAAVAIAALPVSALASSDAQKGTNVMGTSWKYVQKGNGYVETIDKDGKYITNLSSGKHSDHGAVVMKDGKACFTSAMNNSGEGCWTVRSTKIGQTMTTHSDKGEKLRVTRIKYTPLKMPK